MSNDIISRLELACIASCQCLTKTSDFQQHAASCRFRVLNEAIGQLAEQAQTIANLTKIVANDLANAEEQRLRIRDAEEDLRNYRTSAEAEIAVLRKHIEVVSMERNNIALERDTAGENLELVDRLWKDARAEADQRADDMEYLKERQRLLRDALQTYVDYDIYICGPDGGLPESDRLQKAQAALAHTQQPKAEHRCGVRGFAESGDVCPACNQVTGASGPRQ